MFVDFDKLEFDFPLFKISLGFLCVEALSFSKNLYVQMVVLTFLLVIFMNVLTHSAAVIMRGISNPDSKILVTC
jgi:hypothetical protein